MNVVSDGRSALFDIFNILIVPSNETERQIICRPLEQDLFLFVGGLPLPTNLFIFLHRVESIHKQLLFRIVRVISFVKLLVDIFQSL